MVLMMLYGKYKGAVTKKIYLVQIKMKIKILDKLTKSYNRHLKILRADMKNNNTNKLNKGKTKLSQVNMSNNS